MNSIVEHLEALETGLLTHGLHSAQRPDDEAFASTQPFCLDTMSFPCWLQFVFVEKLRDLIAANAPLPSPCNIAAMGQAYAQGAHFPGDLVAVLERIDDAINNATNNDA